MEVLPSLLSEYDPKDIFNADECGLFFNLLPGKTHAFKGGSCHVSNWKVRESKVLQAC
jgi:hypothetical protein